MSRLTTDMISMYRAGIEPWKEHHDKAMRDWDEFENIVASGTNLLGTLIRFHLLHNRLVAAGRLQFDPEFEQDLLKGIQDVLEDAPLVFRAAQEYEDTGCLLAGLDDFRTQYRSAMAIMEQYAEDAATTDTAQAQAISPHYDELREMMAHKIKPANWCDDDDV